MSGKLCAYLILLLEVCSVIFAQLMTTEIPYDLHESELTLHAIKPERLVGNKVNEIREVWKKQVIIQAPTIFQGMETFFKRVFNNSLNEEQRYQEFMTRVLQATNKVKDSVAKVALHYSSKREKLSHKKKFLIDKSDSPLYPKSHHVDPGRQYDMYYDNDKFYV